MTFTADSLADFSGSNVVVTGANSGIGFETARAFAKKGAAVVLACRNPEKAAEALGKLRLESPAAKVSVAALDLSSLDSVRAFADALGPEPVDVLVNNAGIMMVPRGTTKDGFELQVGTNHLGHFALTGLLLGRLLEARAARVVTVSSLYHRQGKIDFENLSAERRYSRTGAYATSKLANLLFTYELERKLRAANARTISVAAHPGWTATNLQAHASFIELLNPIFAQSAEQGALPSIYGAGASGVNGGEYFGPAGFMEFRGPPKRVSSTGRSRDEAIAKRLWDVSSEMTSVRFSALA